MKKVQVHVVDGKVHIVCPECDKGMECKVKNRAKSCGIVCCPTCASKFTVQLDYRQQYRKPSSFSGNGACERVGSFPVTIENMSRNGTRFQICKSGCSLHVGETVSLRFQLNDKNNSDIQVVVKICNSDGNMYGGTFEEKYLSSHVNKAIGFWLR